MKPIRRTKIVCTLGPAVDDRETLRALLRAGMNVARFNFSHGTHEEHAARIDRLRKVAEQEETPVALLLDTKGPEIRTGPMADGSTAELAVGDRITVTTDEVIGTRERISISYATLHHEVVEGDHIYVADGLIDLEVERVSGTDVHCVVRSGGVLGSRKNVNIPGVRVQLPAVTDKDRADIRFAVAHGMDFIAASFIRKPSDVDQIHAILREHDSPIRVIAKIEDQEGLDNIEEIIRVSEGIMVARGDLGVQLPLEDIPLAQKRIISRCRLRNKPVITATHMLESMIVNPRPTRAEITDVANAIFDGTDAVMLSGETAIGRYPVRSCETLHRVALAIERSAEYRERMRNAPEESEEPADIGSAVARAAINVAEGVRASAIIAPSLRGHSPRMLSRFRPAQSIIAVVTSEEVQRQLLLDWGVSPLLSSEVVDTESMIRNAISGALACGLVGPSDRVVTTAGVPLRSAAPINTIRVHLLGTVLNRGHAGFGSTATGRLVKASDHSEARRRLRLDGSEILCTPSLSEAHKDLLSGLAGVVIEGRSELPDRTLLAANRSLVVVSEVPDAFAGFEDGITVTIDGTDLIVYEGVVR